MTDEKSINVLEFNKIKDLFAKYCVLSESKLVAANILPETEFESAKRLLDMTAEAYSLLFSHGISGIEFYDDLGDILNRSTMGSTLSMGELLRIARILKSSQILYSSLIPYSEIAPILYSLSMGIYTDDYLENEIRSKILSEDAMSDTASEKLYQIRQKIKRLNEQIREKLASYIRGGDNKYLQENIITKRGERYVLPVKSEYRSQISGFIHDQSATGSTLFIEPTAILELNNSLREATIEENAEIERILAELSKKVGQIADRLKYNEKILVEFDVTYAKAIYAYKTKAVKPLLNTSGRMNIINGRHPLIDYRKVVPISIAFGSDYRFLLVTGPNTGGKTVTLKMVGLFALMAASGLYIQADEGSEVNLYDSVFCDIGDEQSIEQSLSTFSSHIKNIIGITENVTENSLVLIDEIGAGTDPEEGSAIARAVIEFLLEKRSYGVITTHYSGLKEFAYTTYGIKNASMEFDAETFKPLYKINIGTPGSSNAIEISKMLGLSPSLTSRAYELLDDKKISFENVIKEAEKSRQKAMEVTSNLAEIKAEEEKKLKEIESERNRLIREREKLFASAKAESRRIVAEKSEEANEIIEEIKILFDKAELSSGDLIKASTLRNKLDEMKYSFDEEEVFANDLKPVSIDNVNIGDKVYYKPMDTVCEVLSVNKKRGESEILIGDIKSKVKISDLYFVAAKKEPPKTQVSLKRDTVTVPLTEINVIGMSAADALIEVENFIDKAIVNNLPEVKIIHGKGLKILSKSIHEYLRRNKRVESYRFGKYGEGEQGVTFVKFK